MHIVVSNNNWRHQDILQIKNGYPDRIAISIGVLYIA